ncbi:nucleoside hydrolase [Halobacteria archaeon AArc-m2/3/4]|uniref:Nucleoside hydrolase n=1 Tax=Natronoglomus mannanivorans TaxID=2979990 RepID=A0ABT2QFH5_9EURY|nr:nucleoside hydrolase [Halobacteria archaeon AArc-m2/3/4]
MPVPTPSLPDSTLVDRLEPAADTVRMVLDTDAYNEIDDQFAVVYALGEPTLEVEALYAAPFDNDRSSGPADGMRKSVAELERLLERASTAPAPDGFVFEGSESYLSGPDEPVESPAARDLVERAREHEDLLYVVAIGCPVTVASALLLEPSIREEIVVVWLGGHPHEWHTAAEFNLSQDLHAARVLFGSGVPLVQIPCKNVAEHVKTTVPELSARLEGHSSLGTYLYETVADYGGADRPWWGKEVWDLAAVAWVADPSLVPSHLTASPVLTDDQTWSRDPTRHPIRVARDVDRDGIFRAFQAALDEIA